MEPEVPEGWQRITSVFPEKQGTNWRTYMFLKASSKYQGFVYVNLDAKGVGARAVGCGAYFDSLAEAIAWVECRAIAKSRAEKQLGEKP